MNSCSGMYICYASRNGVPPEAGYDPPAGEIGAGRPLLTRAKAALSDSRGAVLPLKHLYTTIREYT